MSKTAALPGLIVFASDRDATGVFDVYALQPDVTHLVRLARASADDYGINPEPRVSPDGSRVLFEAGLRIRLLDVATGAQVSLPEELFWGWPRTPQPWSPDGSHFALGSQDGLWVVGADGTGGTRITTGEDDAPAWSPDGSFIAFGRIRTGQGVYVVGADGRGLRKLSAVDPDVLAWSPDGREIAFTRVADSGDTATFVIPAAGGAATKVGAGVPAWSPDGSMLAVADRERGLALYTPGGASQRVLTKRGADYPRWAPDGRGVLASVDGELWLFARDGSKAAPITHGTRYGYSSFDATWSATRPARIAGTLVEAAVPFTGPLIAVSRTTGRIVAFPQASGMSTPGGPAGSEVALSAVRAVVADGRGGWYVGGDFRSIGGVACPNLAHVGPDRRVDRGWCPRPDRPIDALLRLGSTLVVGSNAMGRVAGTARSGLAAFDTRSGKLTGWRPLSSGHANMLAADATGRTVYVAGPFARIGGQPRSNFAAVDALTGRPTAFAPNPDTDRWGDAVSAFAVTATRIYAWGMYEHIGGKAAQMDPVALDPHTGTVLSFGKPAIDGKPFTAAVIGDRVFVNGFFVSLGGKHRNNLGAFSASTAAVATWAPLIGRHQMVEQIAVSASDVYAALTSDSHVGDPGARNVVAYSASTAKQVWRARVRPDGSVLAIASAGDLVLVGGLFRNAPAGK